MMKQKDFFNKINFNKTWDESDWEIYFQAHDAYRLAVRNNEIREKPIPRIRFGNGDEVTAFEPVLKAYGMGRGPEVFNQIKSQPFLGDQDPEADYAPMAWEDPHYWGEGAPLASLPIYRDCCRFAIFTARCLEDYLKRRDKAYRKKYSSEFENLRFHANWIAINIAQGHQIGYGQDLLQGNIAKCLRALRHADDCIGLINRVSMRTKSVRLREELFAFAVQIRRVIFMWVDELRSRS